MHAYLLLLLVLLPTALSAQASVSGVLREEGSGAPIEGAVVSVLGPGGAQVAGVLTNASGRFLLSVLPGTYRLRAERIGYRSTVTEPFAVAAGARLERELVASTRAIELAGIRVSSQRRCVVRPREGVEANTLWEEARKALNAAALTEEQALVRYRIRRYERDLDPRTLAVRGEESQSLTGYAERPFLSRPAEDLAREGYIRAEGADHVYYAPDAPVLLSDPFLDTHCFRVRLDRAPEPGLVGLAFEPIRSRRLPDIEGVLWMDAATAELRHVEFDYTGFPLPESSASGGRVEYERLPTGAWIVRRWWIRMPVLGREAGTGRSSVVGLHESGGEVSEVTLAGGLRLEAEAGATLRGTVYDSVAGAPLAAATVYLSGTSYSAESDSAGAFRIERLPAGAYTVGFLHPRLEALGVLLPSRPVTLARSGEARTELAIPSLTTALALACRDETRDGGGAVLVGEVRDPRTGRGIPGVRVVLASTDPAGARRPVTAVTDERGRYRFCRAPVGAVRIQAEVAPRRGEPADALLVSGEPVRLDLSLSLAPPAPPPGSTRTWGEGAPAHLVGQVLDALTARPIAGAAVRLGDDGRVHLTDERGEFRIAGVAAGIHVLGVRHAGYTFEPRAITLTAGSNRVEVKIQRESVRPEEGGGRGGAGPPTATSAPRG